MPEKCLAQSSQQQSSLYPHLTCSVLKVMKWELAEKEGFPQGLPRLGQKLAPLRPLAFPTLPVLSAKAVPLNMKTLSSLQEGCQTHGWALSLRSEKVVPASSMWCHRDGRLGFLILDAHRAGGTGVGVGSVGSCLTRF